ncbi:MAG: hypothetical protein DRQ47_01940 [Gammaproteobacteria bacterium]|nr:MAG: hypothetical protein DRQ47_01940 [Gammaproteobacteria bacterium]
MNKKNLKKRLATTEAELLNTRSLLNDLIEYLERKDIIPSDQATFETWETDLSSMRIEAQKEKVILRSKNTLKDAGYFVVKDENEIDAAKLKKWLSAESE